MFLADPLTGNTTQVDLSYNSGRRPTAVAVDDERVAISFSDGMIMTDLLEGAGMQTKGVFWNDFQVTHDCLEWCDECLAVAGIGNRRTGTGELVVYFNNSELSRIASIPQSERQQTRKVVGSLFFPPLQIKANFEPFADYHPMIAVLTADHTTTIFEGIIDDPDFADLDRVPLYVFQKKDWVITYVLPDVGRLFSIHPNYLLATTHDDETQTAIGFRLYPDPTRGASHEVAAAIKGVHAAAYLPHKDTILTVERPKQEHETNLHFVRYRETHARSRPVELRGFDTLPTSSRVLPPLPTLLMHPTSHGCTIIAAPSKGLCWAVRA